MDDFIERMLERTNKRQERLATLLTEAPSSSPKLPSVESLPKVQEQLPPQRRRNRLAELASRVDQWLENDLETKPIENNLIDDLNVKSVNPGNKVDKKLSTMPPVDETVSETKVIKTNENEAPVQQQQFKKEPNINRVKQISQPHKSSDNGPTPLWQSPNLAPSTLTVAQRRALFEQNMGVQQPIKKPKSTTIVTISMTKTTPTTTTIDNISTSTCPIPNNIKTPPPKPCIKIQNEIPSKNVQKQLHPWTPPCIKNVLLKKQSIKQLDDEPHTIPDNEMTEKAVATSSPINSTTVSSADRIAMSVGRVRFMPPSPSGGLYPDLSLIENDDKNNLVENQVIGCKRRNDGSNALNASTTSSDSMHKDSEDDEMVVAKRSRCKLQTEDPGSPNMVACQDDSTTESSLVLTSAVTPTNSCGNHSLSTLSGNVTANSLSQICTSFTYYPNNDNPCQTFDVNHIASTNTLSENKQQQQSNNDNQMPNEIQLINNQEYKKPLSPSLPPSSKCNQPALVHTVSTYRKQQQQLRLTPKTRNLEQNDDRSSALLKQRLQLLDDADDDEEDYMLQELETAASRARHLERIVVPQQDNIIEQATQALNTCDMYRQRSTMSSKFSSEHVHAERLLLIAGLRRTDAVREAQRLRVERTLLSNVKDEKYYKQLKICGDGKKLIFESLRVPLLSSVISGSNKNKYNASEGVENLTRWPGGYRYFVCAIRAEATIRRPPVTVATRPADVVEESLLRFSGATPAYQSENELSYGYVEFITKKPAKSSGGRKCLMPTEAEGGPIIINGLDDGGWKITVELYGLSSTATGELDHHGGTCKEHDSPEKTKSVLDKLWSTVTTPNKEAKKHHPSTATCIESPGGSMTVRNTVFRQLGYFVFSDGQVDRQQFTLNKVHQSSGARNTSNATSQDTVRLRMHLLDEGEHYAYEDDEDRINFENPSSKYGSHYTTVAAMKPLTLPPECKRTEGFLTLFDDHELRTTHTFERGPQWHRQSNVGSSISGGTTMWRRLWFSADIVDVPEQHETSDNRNEKQQKNYDIGQQQTIVLRYWMYPEHAEQQREPLGALDLSRCLPPLLPNDKSSTTAKGQQQQQMPVPAAPALPDLCARPNTLRLLIHGNDNGYHDSELDTNVDDPLLLAADTADERREWCDTINAAVRAVGEHRERIGNAKTAHLKQEEQEKEKLLQQRRQQEQQRIGVWPITPSSNSKNYSKKKKLYK